MSAGWSILSVVGSNTLPVFLTGLEGCTPGVDGTGEVAGMGFFDVGPCVCIGLRVLVCAMSSECIWLGDFSVVVSDVWWD